MLKVENREVELLADCSEVKKLKIFQLVDLMSQRLNLVLIVSNYKLLTRHGMKDL